MASEIRVNQIQNRSGLTTTTFTDTGVTISGILTVSENLNVGGVLTYEDVTNVDSLGVGTFRDGLRVTGICTATTFHGDGSALTGINSDLVSDTSPQLGGNLDTNSKNIVFGDSSGATVNRLTFGGQADLKLFHDGTNSVITNATGDLYINNNADTIIKPANDLFLKPQDGENGISVIGNGAVELYHDNTKTAWTHGSGFNIKGKNTSDNTELIITGNEGQPASILMSADDGDDNADHWRMYSNADNSFTLNSYAGGSYQSILKGTSDRSIELNYQGSKKLETTSSGIDITGNLTLPTTDAKIQLKDGNNYIQFVNADKTFKFMNAWGAGEFTFHVNGGKRLEIDANGRVILNGAAVGSNEYLTIGPNGSTTCDMAFRLNNDNDARIKFYDNAGVWRGGLGYTTYANNSTYPNFHDSFYFQTDPGSNGTLSTAIWINNAGQFIKPLTYQFLVETNGTSVSSSGWSKLTGLTIDTAHSTGVSNGSYWSNSNQRFTIPTSGTYNFFFGGWGNYSTSTGDRYAVCFRINNGSFTYISGGSYAAVDSPLNGHSINLKLSVNDYVELWYYSSGNNTWGGGHRVYWGGYFLG